MIEKGFVIKLRSLEVKSSMEDHITPFQRLGFKHKLVIAGTASPQSFKALISEDIVQGVERYKDYLVSRLDLSELEQQTLCFTVNYCEIVDGMFVNSESWMLNEKISFVEK